MSESKDDEYSVSINKTALTRELIKYVIIVVFLLGPLILLVLVDDWIRSTINPQPNGPTYWGIVGIVLIWYAITLAFVLPYLTKKVDKRYAT
ncbi:MAG: hypothetical protein K9W43_09885 [Candidatus Thorarchaeota archaeon]|nr:hypothetical protein [Candidatus Thorarchaeota archaeon]